MWGWGANFFSVLGVFLTSPIHSECFESTCVLNEFPAPPRAPQTHTTAGGGGGTPSLPCQHAASGRLEGNYYEPLPFNVVLHSAWRAFSHLAKVLFLLAQLGGSAGWEWGGRPSIPS